MVRVWQVDPVILDGQRLTGAHNEAHILLSVHLKILRIALHQGVQVQDINWDGIRVGWRSHPQLTWWFGKVGAMFEYHNIMADELASRKRAKGEEVEPHKSPIDLMYREYQQLVPEDTSYGSYWDIIKANPDREIRDLRHLFEKWERQQSEGRPPKGHAPALAFHDLSMLVPNPAELSRMLDEKLLT